MLRKFLPLIFLGWSSSAVVAQQGAECARIANPDARLSCYDALFRETTKEVVAGKWSVTDEKSTLDDSRKVTLFLESEEELRGRFGNKDKAALVIRCEENTTVIYVRWGGHFMSEINGGGRVDYRIDDQRPQHVSMRVSNNNEALGLWRGSVAIPFIRNLLTAEQFYVRATPFSESRVEATFMVSGLDDAIKPLREACNW